MITIRDDRWLEDTKDMIEKHEGVRLVSYLDSRGIPTIGVGFNLMRGDAHDRLALVGSSYPFVIGGGALSADQAQELFDRDVADCVSDMFVMFPRWSSLPAPIRAAMVGMRFQLGAGRFAAFENMIAAIKARNWVAAANEMTRSLWYAQMPKRSSDLRSRADDEIELVLSAGEDHGSADSVRQS